MNKFLMTIPHSGEKVPELTPWLKGLTEEILMCDVDRYVDQIYAPVINELKIPLVKTEWHRYAVDLNRIPEDIDASSVVGEKNKVGTHPRGYHWVVTTLNNPLLPEPMTRKTHDALTELIYDPFHQNIQRLVTELKSESSSVIYHLDAHSMPSVGTKMHKDPGQRRADIVVSDSLGQSCSEKFRDLVIASYVIAGFKVGYNWPYVGGRVTERYGQPKLNHHTIQVELNRDLYMNEMTKKQKPEIQQIQQQIKTAISYLLKNLPNL